MPNVEFARCTGHSITFVKDSSAVTHYMSHASVDCGFQNTWHLTKSASAPYFSHSESLTIFNLIENWWS